MGHRLGVGDPGVGVRLEDVIATRGGHVVFTVDRLELPAGASIALIGANGAGKSTLLDLVAGTLTASAGRVIVHDRDAAEAADLIAYVPQATEVPRHLPITVIEAVAIGLYRETGAWRRFGSERRTRVREALDRLDLGSLAERPLHELSGGQRQRVLVATGLVAAAPLLLLDEPVTGLDAPSRARISEAVAAERAAGRTVITATHGIDEARAADIVVLLAGRVVADGPPNEVLTPERLAEAYGVAADPGAATVVVDDGHHHHHDHHHHDHHHHDHGHPRGRPH